MMDIAFKVVVGVVSGIGGLVFIGLLIIGLIAATGQREDEGEDDD